jgi:hypothetical protein
MELQQALDQAQLILDEEQARPTINYRYILDDWPEELRWDFELKKKGLPPAYRGAVALPRMREKRPREVYENPNQWKLDSTNYSLLMAIFAQLSPANRRLFVGGLVNLLIQTDGAPATNTRVCFPLWNGRVSSLPLVAECCNRNGCLDLLLAALDKTEFPTTSIALMMIQFEEIVSLNFNVFSDADLAAMPIALKGIRERSELQTWTSRRRGGKQIVNMKFRHGFSERGTEIVKAIDAFLKQCQQARFFYLKGVLQQTTNLEIENDKIKVVGFLDGLGFDPLLTASLAKAENLYGVSSDAFDLKSCLGHLRSFLEELHVQSCPRFALPSEAAPVKWGVAMLFLRQHGVITQKEETFITTLYTLVSDEAIHPLIAEREYARLFRNIVIEYGLLFLTILQKKGVTISP